MKIQNLFTSGKMNKDLDERLLPQGEYRDALNIKVANSNGSDVGAIENALSKKAKKNFLPMQPGDVPVTYANIDDLKKDFNFQPSTSIEKGIMKFVIWYKKNS